MLFKVDVLCSFPAPYLYSWTKVAFHESCFKITFIYFILSRPAAPYFILGLIWPSPSHPAFFWVQAKELSNQSVELVCSQPELCAQHDHVGETGSRWNYTNPKLSSRKASQGLFVHTLMIWNFGNDWFEHHCYIQSCEQDSFHRTLCKPAKKHTLPASLGIKSVNRATNHLIRWSWVSMSTSIK